MVLRSCLSDHSNPVHTIWQIMKFEITNYCITAPQWCIYVLLRDAIHSCQVTRIIDQRVSQGHAGIPVGKVNR